MKNILLTLIVATAIRFFLIADSIYWDMIRTYRVWQFNLLKSNGCE